MTAIRPAGFALIDLATLAPVWRGGLPARIELFDAAGFLTLRADFDKAGLVVPNAENATHKMVERFEIEAPNETALRGVVTEMFDGENVIADPHWTEPAP